MDKTCTLVRKLSGFILIFSFFQLHAQEGTVGNFYGNNGKVYGPTVGHTDSSQSVPEFLILPDQKKLHISTVNGKVHMIRYTPGGTLDASFGSNGVITTAIRGFVKDALIMRDGNFFVLTTYELIKFFPDGRLDSSFAGDGQVPIYITASSMALQMDDKLLVGGTHSSGGEYAFAALRLNPNGSYDTSFDGDGMVTTNMNAGYEEGNGIAIQPDGRIVLGGHISNSSITSPEVNPKYDAAVVRFLGNGALDLSFDGDGKVTIPIFGYEFKGGYTAVQPDGKILIAGSDYYMASEGADFSVYRLNANGTLDRSFGQSGWSRIEFGNYDILTDLVVLELGMIIVSGYSSCPICSDQNAENNLAIARLLNNGQLDPNFDGDGKNSIDIANTSDYGGRISGEGVIYIAGFSSQGGITKASSVVVNQYRAVNFRNPRHFYKDADFDFFGSRDQRTTAFYYVREHTFDSSDCNDGDRHVFPGAPEVKDGRDNDCDGVIDESLLVQTSLSSDHDEANAVGVLADGRIVMGGYAINPQTNQSEYALVRYTRDGALDSSFGGDGKVFLTTGLYGNVITDISVDNFGNLTAVGYGHNGTNFDFVILKLKPDGEFDPVFSGDGKMMVDFNGRDDRAHAIVIPPGNADYIYVVGQAQNPVTGRNEFATVRLYYYGDYDTRFSGDGKATTNFGSDHVAHTAVLLNGQIIVGGGNESVMGGHYTLVKYNFDGSLDTSFDRDGIVTGQVPFQSVSIQDLTIQPDGKILAAGGAGFTVLRFLPDGRPDPDFGNGAGHVIPAVPGTNQFATAIALQGEKILVSGSNYINNSDMILVRLLRDGKPDNSFDGDGIMSIDFNQSNDLSMDMALRNDIVYLAGRTSIGNGDFDMALAIIPTNSHTTIPARIQAEDYSNMKGVQTEATTDEGGGLNVGYIDIEDYIDYNIDVPEAGTYQLDFRLATPNPNAEFTVSSMNSGPFGGFSTRVTVPNTGGYQNWVTHSIFVNLIAGRQTIRLYSTGGPWNINWLEFKKENVPTYTQIPARIEAEKWSSMAGVQTENTSDEGGGSNVGYIDNGDYIEYNIYVPFSTRFDLSFRLATPNVNNPKFEVRTGNTLLATINVPVTGNWQAWQTVTIPVNLPQGNQTIRLTSTGGGGWNINWLQFSWPGTITTQAKPQTVTEQNLVSSGAAVYPNPVRESFTLRLDNKYAGPVTMQLLNMAGAVQKEFRFNKPDGPYQGNFNLNNIPKGEYILRIQSRDSVESLKIIRL
jgi:uncharacterized delta-60 repeat protein